MNSNNNYNKIVLRSRNRSLMVEIYNEIMIERGKLLVKTIELPTRFAQRLLHGSILCIMVIDICLLIIGTISILA